MRFHPSLPRFAWIFAHAAAIVSRAGCQTVPFTDSNLPVVVIDTRGKAVPNQVKVEAHLGVVDNGRGRRNAPADPFNSYDGEIGIETRGSSSQGFPKKSYAVETRDPSGNARNTPVLGFPAENDWVLYGPYTDKSLMRNALMYRLSNAIGRYAPRTRFCELVLNGDYRGVYVWMEKVKRDKHRVDIAAIGPTDNSGDPLTGGYIVKIDKVDGEENDGWISEFAPDPAYGKTILYQFHYPRPEDITFAQVRTIRSAVSDFERAMAGPDFNDPEAVYLRFLRIDTFVDYFLLNEIARNVDAYRLSAFLCKDRDSRDGRLFMGPLWDFDLGCGNADYYDGWKPEGWQLDFLATDENFRQGDTFLVPFWWVKVRNESGFQDRVRVRWKALRQGLLRTEALLAEVDATADTLAEAMARNFARWPVLGRYVWPNAFVGNTVEEELDTLKAWLSARVHWMDSAVDRLGHGPQAPSSAFTAGNAFPNPFRNAVRILLELPDPVSVTARVFDAAGRLVRSWPPGTQPAGRYDFVWDGRDAAGREQAAGVYLVRIQAGPHRKTVKAVFIP